MSSAQSNQYPFRRRPREACKIEISALSPFANVRERIDDLEHMRSSLLAIRAFQGVLW